MVGATIIVLSAFQDLDGTPQHLFTCSQHRKACQVRRVLSSLTSRLERDPAVLTLYDLRNLMSTCFAKVAEVTVPTVLLKWPAPIWSCSSSMLDSLSRCLGFRLRTVDGVRFIIARTGAGVTGSCAAAAALRGGGVAGVGVCSGVFSSGAAWLSTMGVASASSGLV